jgi:nucleotide-binding universal stress UspA family protein
MTWTLVATDGSEQSTRAVELVASIAWPKETMFGVVGVVPTLSDLAGLPWTPVVPSNLDQVEATELHRAQDATWAAVDTLRAAGLKANCRVMRGRPADVIVHLAERVGADLIVVGSRGLGRLDYALLGSVSEAVIDRAPCPVLVARTNRLGRTVIADDGSPEAEVARAFVQARPYLLGDQTRLVGVAPSDTLLADSLVPLAPRGMEMLVEGRAALRHGLIQQLRTDADEIASAGVPATSEMRIGNPVHEILEAATAFNAGLIVVGTHGRHGLTRLALGSVSHGIVHGAHCSVLVAHATAPVAQTTTADGTQPTSIPRSESRAFPVPTP